MSKDIADETVEAASTNGSTLEFTSKDLLTGGGAKPETLEIKMTDGRTGHVFRRDLPAGDVLDFVESEEGPERNEALMRLVARAIVNQDGSPKFSEMDLGELRDMPVNIFQQMATAVTEASGVVVEESEGNA